MLNMNRHKNSVTSLGIAAKPVLSFHLYKDNSDNRAKAENAVKKIFRSAYGADINSYLPCLLTAELDDNIAAVVGVRRAIDQRLFLEKYLSTPIETAVSKTSGVIISRVNLVEIGNLVSCKAGISRQLFIILTFALAKAEIEWVSFTATAQVEQLLSKLSLSTIVVGQATEKAIINGKDNWGSYYVNCPNVCVGNVLNAVNELNKSSVFIKMAQQHAATIDLLAKQIKSSSHRVNT